MSGPQDRTPIPRGRTLSKDQPNPPSSTDIKLQPPGVRFAPQALFLLRDGIDQFANAVRPTLGPTPRIVAMDQVVVAGGGKPPELLDDGATIVRRMIEVPNAYVNAGAMLIRHILWSVHEEVGDGSTTAAMIMQALVREGVRLTAAGWNPMVMRSGIEKGVECCVTTLRDMARPVQTEVEVAGLALAASGDADLSRRLGEIFDTLGADGHIEVQAAFQPGLRHEYIEGGYWNSGWVSTAFANNDLQNEVTLTDPYVLIAHGHIESWEDLSPLVSAIANESGSLFIIAMNVAGTALNLLLANKEKIKCAAVKSPSFGEFMDDQLHDIAILTGTHVVLNDMSESLAKVKLSDLGRARSITANKDYFGIIGGHGDPKLLRERIALVRNQLKGVNVRETDKLLQLRQRLGKLAGGVAVLYVAGMTEATSKERQETVERTVNTVRRAQLGGIVPGGGMAYVQCIKALKGLKLPPEQQVGVDALARALEEPLRAIARNSGADDGPIAAAALHQKPGWGYNALTNRFEDLWAAGIVDPLPVVQTALEKAVSGAIMTLTTSATVHRKDPPMSTEP